MHSMATNNPANAVDAAPPPTPDAAVPPAPATGTVGPRRLTECLEELQEIGLQFLQMTAPGAASDPLDTVAVGTRLIRLSAEMWARHLTGEDRVYVTAPRTGQEVYMVTIGREVGLFDNA